MIGGRWKEKMELERLTAEVLIFDRPNLKGEILGSVVLVGGSADLKKDEREGSYKAFQAGERFEGVGLKFIVLPNLPHPTCTKPVSWMHPAHPLDTAIFQHAHECLGALNLVGLSRGSWQAQEWVLSHPH